MPENWLGDAASAVGAGSAAAPSSLRSTPEGFLPRFPPVPARLLPGHDAHPGEAAGLRGHPAVPTDVHPPGPLLQGVGEGEAQADTQADGQAVVRQAGKVRWINIIGSFQCT